jgi:hypothetical protein
MRAIHHLYTLPPPQRVGPLDHPVIINDTSLFVGYTMALTGFVASQT